MTIEIEGIEMHVLTLDALIQAREAMDRPHDREVLRQLKAIRKLRQEP
jgi:hypothetical protein